MWKRSDLLVAHETLESMVGGLRFENVGSNSHLHRSHYLSLG